MLRSTRPIKVAEIPPSEEHCPHKLNLLQADLFSGSASLGAGPATPPRRIDLPRRKIDLGAAADAAEGLDLSDPALAKSAGPRPPAGLSTVREFAYVLPAAERNSAEAASDDPGEPVQIVHSAALARVVETWPSLSPAIRAAILAMVEAVAAGLDVT